MDCTATETVTAKHHTVVDCTMVLGLVQRVIHILEKFHHYHPQNEKPRGAVKAAVEPAWTDLLDVRQYCSPKNTLFALPIGHLHRPDTKLHLRDGSSEAFVREQSLEDAQGPNHHAGLVDGRTDSTDDDGKPF